MCASDLEARTGPQTLGRTFIDENGRFVIVFATSGQAAVGHRRAAKTKRKLRLHILNQQSNEVYMTEVQAHADPKHTLETGVPRPGNSTGVTAIVNAAQTEFAVRWQVVKGQSKQPARVEGKIS